MKVNNLVGFVTISEGAFVRKIVHIFYYLVTDVGDKFLSRLNITPVP